MNSVDLEAVERRLHAAAQVAYEADAKLDDPRWNGLNGRILEDFAIVADYVKRSVHGFPDDPHYVLERTGDLVAAAITLHQRVMQAQLECRHAIVDQLVDEYTGRPQTLERPCHLPRGHAGDHDPNPQPRNQLLDAADHLERNVTQLVDRIRWNILHDDEHTADALTGVSRDLVDLGGELRHRLEQHRGASGR